MAFCFIFSISHAIAEDLEGTFSVNFEPLSTEGVTEGCSLVFRTIARDYVYNKGKPVVGVGNITYMVTSPTKFGMSVKLGVGKVEENMKMQAPHFAYIKTISGSTAGVKNKTADSDMKGFRMFVPQVSESSMSVITDILDGKPATVGFNLKKGGMDVLLPLDFTVANTIASDDGTLKRLHSQDAITGFGKCFMEVSEKLKL